MVQRVTGGGALPASADAETDATFDGLSAGFDDAYGREGRADAEPKPVIQWRAGALPEVVDAAEAALMGAGSHDYLFQRGPFLVRVTRRKAMSLRAFKRPAGGLGITTVDRPYLVEQLSRAATWEKFDTRSGDFKVANAPEIVATTYLARSGHWRLPWLLSAISAPTLRPDGTLLQMPGYDESMASWYDPCGLDFPKVSDSPTEDEISAAKHVLMEAIESIPFETITDMSVALALMLTALVRRSLPSAPLGAITAPTPGSGKTLLGDCIAIMATGVAAPAMQYPASDEEAEKVALSVLMDGDAVVLIDNIERPLQGAWLCSILTSETHQGRMLGRNEMISVPTTTVFLATGNKLVIKGDLRTRTLLCTIDAKCENPELRKFDIELRDYFAANRVRLVHAGLTVMRGYLSRGEKPKDFRPWGRFEQWSKFCREPLLWLGFPDPCDSYQLIAAEDPERVEHLQMVMAWQDAFRGKAKTAREAIETAGSDVYTALHEVLREVAKGQSGALSAKRLAGWLRSRADRIIDGKCFKADGKTREGVTLWKVITIDKKPVPPPSA